MRLSVEGDVGDLAVILGLTQSDGTVRSQWFADPLAELGGVLATDDRRHALFALVESALAGEAETISGIDGSRWIPLVEEDGSGVHLTLNDQGDAAGVTTVGLGGRAQAVNNGVTVTADLHTAAIAIPTIGADRDPILAPGTVHGDLVLHIEVDLGSQALPGEARTVAIEAVVPTDGRTPWLRLRVGLAGSGGAEIEIDTSEADLESQLRAAILTLVDSQLRVALSGSPIRHLFALIGLGPAIDGSSGALPALDIAQLVAEQSTAPIGGWFRAVFTDPVMCRRWLGHLRSFLLASDPFVPVAGNGSTAQPWMLPLIDSRLRVELVLESDVEHIRLTPTLLAATATTVAGRPAECVGAVTVPTMVIGNTFSIDISDVGGLIAASYGDQANALVPAPPDGSPTSDPFRIGIDQAVVGLAVEPATGRFEPVLELRGVLVEDETFAVVDLTDLDAVVAQAGAAADSILTDLLSAIDVSRETRAFLAVIGAIDPPDAGPGWPVERTPGRLLTDPAAAVRDYIDAVCDADLGHVLLDEAAIMVGFATPPNAAPDGGDRWVRPLHLSPVDDDGQSEPTASLILERAEQRLSLCLQLQPARAVGVEGEAVVANLTVGLLSWRSGSNGGDSSPPLDLRWLDRIGAGLAADSPFALHYGGVVLACAGLGGSLTWGRDHGFVPTIELNGATVTGASGNQAALSSIVFDRDAGGFRFQGPPPWDAVELLLSQMIGGIDPGGPAELLCTLLGWGSSSHSHSGLGMTNVESLAASAPALDELLDDPLGTLVSWASDALISDAGPGFARELQAAVAEAVAGGSFNTRSGGAGSLNHPWSAAFAAGGEASLRLDLGRRVNDTATLRSTLGDPRIQQALNDGDPDLISGRDLQVMVDHVRHDLVDLDRVIAGRNIVGTADRLLEALEDTDGVVTLDQVTLAGVTPVAVLEAAHNELPGGFELASMAPAADPARTIYVSVPFSGLAPWAGVAAPVIDLRGRTPETITSAELGSAGPWNVWIDGPSIADLAGTLDAIVVAVGSAPQPLTIVGHGLAGTAAQLLAVAPPSGLERVVAVGSPVRAASADRLAPIDVAEELRLLRTLHASASIGARGDIAAQVVGVLGPAFDDSAPSTVISADGAASIPSSVDIDRYLAPLVSGSVDPSVDIVVVIGLLPYGAGLLALAGAIHAAIATGTDPASTSVPSSWGDDVAGGIGLAVGSSPTAAAAGAVVVDASVSADLVRLRLPDGTDPGSIGERLEPAICIDLVVRRSDGWLVTPEPASLTAGAHCRVRELHLHLNLGLSGVPGISVTAVDAAALGTHQALWEMDLMAGGGGLSVEQRMILEATVEAMQAAAAGSPVRHLEALLRQVGLIDPSGSVVFGAVESLLLAPTSFHPGSSADPVALCGLLGSVVGGVAVGTVLTVESGPTRIVIDFGGPPFTARVEFGAGAAAGEPGTSVGIGLDHTVSATTGSAHLTVVTGHDAQYRLAAEVSPSLGLTCYVAVDGTGAPVSRAGLWPTVERDRLEQILWSVLPAHLIRMLFDELSIRHTAIVHLAAALGGDSGVTLTLLEQLLRDPAGMLAAARHRPGGLVAVVEAFGALIGDDGSGADGEVVLPGGFRLAAVSAPDPVTGPSVELRLPAPTTSGVTGSGAVGVRFGGAGLEPTGAFSLVLRDDTATSTATLAGLQADIGAGTLAMTLNGTEVALIPGPGDFTSLAAAGATALLPLLLDRAAEVDLAGTAPIAVIGDALDLRSPGASGPAFDKAKLQLFVDGPIDRIRARSTAVVAAVADLVDPIIDDVSVNQGEITLTLSGAGFASGTVVFDTVRPTPTVRLGVSGLTPVNGLSVDASVTLGPTVELAVDVEVTDPGLLAVGGVTFVPAAGLSVGSDGAVSTSVGLWSNTDTPRRGLFAVYAVGSSQPVSVLCRSQETAGGPIVDSADLGDCWLALIGSHLLPLVVDLVAPSLQATLNSRPIGVGTPRVRELLTAADDDGLFVASGATMRVAPGLLSGDDPLLDLGQRGLATLTAALDEIGAVTVATIAPFDLNVASHNGIVGVALTFQEGKSLRLVESSSLRLTLEVEPSWLTDGTPPGVSFRFLEVADPTSIAPAAVFAIAGVGLRASSPSGDHLLDAGVTLGGVGTHVLLEVGDGPLRTGGQLVLDRIGLPLTAGSGSNNPVAASVIGESDDPTGSDAARADFSPRLSILNGNLAFRAGDGDGPWWLPIQRAFGPLYIEHVGIGATSDGETVTHLEFLVDGGASLLGLAVQVDDLSVEIPLATATDLSSWNLDLAALAISYSGGGVEAVGGFGRFETPVGIDYRGMAKVSFPPYGASGVGAYGMFDDGAGGEYASLFVFVAVNAPLGGPPPFFVTGLAGGMGINRALEISDDINDLPNNVFLQAMGPSSGDPMGMLEEMGTQFPPDRGALWFAAGLTFTSFALVKTRAVLAVEINDGLEIDLLGLSELVLPNESTAVASVELALHARFSTVDGVFSVMAQLTDNSWLISRSCRLTGGFAFVVWFAGPQQGQFVLTLGGYHPRFTKPEPFPDVPRLGFAWEPGGGVTIKGGAYFALTSSAVMAGGELEVAYRKGIAWASFEAGAHLLVSWDPYYFDIEVYVQISAGVKFRACFIVCKTISLGFDFGVDVHIWGPELRGIATLDLSVITVPVRFGASGGTNSANYLGWSAFRDKYLLSPPGEDGQRHAVAFALTSGQLLTGRGGSDDQQDGSSTAPFKVTPDFSAMVETRAPFATLELVAAASNGSNVVTSSGHALGLGPMGVSAATSKLSVQLKRGSLHHIGGLQVDTVTGKVPHAVWRHTAPQDVKAEAKVVDGWTGLRMTATASSKGRVISAKINDYTYLKARPLPLLEPNKWGLSLTKLRNRAGKIDDLFLGSTSIQDVAAHLMASTGVTKVADGRALTIGDVDLATPAIVGSATEAAAMLSTEFQAPILVGSLADGIQDPKRAQVKAREVSPDVVAPDVVDRRPRLLARLAGSSTPVDGAATTVSRRERVTRKPAPTLDEVRRNIASTLGSTLTLAPDAVPWQTPRPARLVRSRGSSVDRIRRLGNDRQLVELAEQLDRDVVRRSGAVHQPDAVAVWELPSTERTDVAADTVVVAGTARIVCVDSAGSVLVDKVVTKDAVAVDPHAHRMAVAPVAAAPTPRSGWVGSNELAGISGHVFLAANAVVRAVGAVVTRRRQRVDVGSVLAATALATAEVIETTLAADTRTVVVVVDREAADLRAGLDGSDLAAIGLELLGADMSDKPRVVPLESRGQTALAIGVKAARGGRPVMRYQQNGQARLAGVVGLTGRAAEVVITLQGRGLDSIDPGPPHRLGGAPAKIEWRSGQ